jgi:peptide/nickel transport system permease protein
MQSYILRRILLLIPTMIIVSLIVFFMVRFIPGDAVDMIQANLNRAGGTVHIEREQVEKLLGLDVPAHIQYLRWIGNIITHGDFGNSLYQKTPVIDMVLSKLPLTLELTIIAMVVSILLGIPIGILSAVRQDTIGDYIARSISIILIAMPVFWIGTMVMIYPSILWGWSPPIRYVPFLQNPMANLGIMIIPGLILGMTMSGGEMRLTRTMMLEVMRQDYVRTAWAKGLRERVVIMRHGIKNAFIPVITNIGQRMAYLIGGAVIIEQIFGLPGMGQLILNALLQRDYPVVSVVTLFFSIFVIIINLFIDLSYSWLDPRTKYS